MFPQSSRKSFAQFVFMKRIWPGERMFDVRCLMFDLARDAHLKFAFML